MSRADWPAVADAVLFDLDGTLLDLPVDIEPVRREVERLLAEAGQGGPALPLLEAIERAAAAVAMDRGEAAGRELRAQARCLIDVAELTAVRGARPRPGAVEVVARLGCLGLRLGIVTDNGRACLAPALAAAGLDASAFGAAVTRDDIEHPKPAPDGVILAARTLCPSGGAIWYAGDSPRDVAASRAAVEALGPDLRLRIVGVMGGRRADELQRAGPDDLVSDLTAFASLVDARQDH
jgi:phosphoglycolate phosphatase-like HAD superfamily hydrolase